MAVNFTRDLIPLAKDWKTIGLQIGYHREEQETPVGLVRLKPSSNSGGSYFLRLLQLFALRRTPNMAEPCMRPVSVCSHPTTHCFATDL